MRKTYCDEDDISVIRRSDRPVSSDVSQDWSAHIIYAGHGTTVEIVLLDAKTKGACPLVVDHALAA